MEKTLEAVSKQEDKRWRAVNRTMRLNGSQPHALIETLHSVQESFGYLETDSLEYVAESLELPLSHVYGVATFYHFFKMRPPGKHTCVVCMGTACYIGGAANILNGIKKDVGIGPGETTEDKEVSLVTARCLGSCGLAPAVVFDGDVRGKLSTPAVLERILEWRNNDA